MKKKTWIAILVSIFSCLVIAGIVLAVLFLPKGEKPEKVEIKEESGVVCIFANGESKYGFTFRFRNDQSDVKISSNFDFLEIDDEVSSRLEIGKTYMVSACINNNLGNEASYFSDEVSWVSCDYLKSPTISLQGQKIVWNSVNHADYYKIFYNPNGNLLTYSVQNTECALELLQGGVSDIYVVSASNKDYYYDSKVSNMLKNVTVVHELLGVLDVELSQSKVLTVYTAEKIDKLVLCLGASKSSFTSYDLVNLNAQKVGDRYKIQVDISYVYSGQSCVGVKPKTDTYNNFSGEIKWINT